MTLSGILRPGLAQLRVMDLDKTLEHYTKRLGLVYVGETEDGRVMLKGYDEFDHHSIVLRLADHAGLDYIAFKASDKETVDRIVKTSTEELGYNMTVVEANTEQPGYGKINFFDIPSGHKIGVYNEVEMAEQHPMVHNPHIWDQEPHGMRVTHFDHALLYGTNQAETVKWFTDVLGMSITEVINNPDETGHICTWLSGNNRGHDIAVLDFPEPGKLHHISFHLQTWSDVGHAADIIGRYGISLDAGPMRHGITRGQTIYFFDPSGNRNETFAGGYEYFPDHPLRYWDAENVGEGIFYYDKALNDRFLNVYT